MNINQKIQEFLTEHQYQKKRRIFTAVLSLMIVFSVVSSLIMPAISMTMQDLDDAAAVDTIDAEPAEELEEESNPEEFAEPEEQALSENVMLLGAGTTYKDAPNGAVDFKDKINAASTKPDPLTGGSNSSVTGKFEIGYSFPSGNNGVGFEKNVTSGKQPYIYYRLPDNIQATEDYYENEHFVTDGSDAWYKYRTTHGITSENAGNFSIDQETGLVVIKFYDDYLKFIDTSGGFSGKLSFDGKVNRADTKDGDQKIDFGDKSITITFDDKKVTANKSSYKDGSDPLLIHWTITIQDPSKYGNLNGKTLTDEMFSKMEGNIKTTPENIGSLNGNTFTFNEGADTKDYSHENIKIEYTTRVTEADLKNLTDGKIKNNAILKTDDGDLPLSSEQNYDSSSVKASIQKTGTPTYQVDGTKGFMEWQLKVSRQYGFSLKDYKIQDDMLKTGTILKITDKNGTDITSSVSVDKTTGTATISSDADEVTILYRTPAENHGGDGNGSYRNKASVTPPDKDTPDDEKEITPKYDDSNLFDVQKADGSFDQKTESVTWNITIDSTKNNNKGTLEGYVISDEAFSRLSGGLTAANIKEATKNGTAVSGVTFVKNSDGTYTIHGDVTHLVLSYQLPLTDAEKQARLELAANSTLPITNTATVKDDKDNEKSDSGTVYVPTLVDGIEKKLTSQNKVTDNSYYDAATNHQKQELSWEVTMHQYRGFSTDSKAYVDVMDATGNGEHYITPEQASKIQIAAETINGTGKTLVLGTDYTIKFYSDKNHEQEITNFTGDAKAKSFQITFLSPVDDAKYVQLVVDYQTTADVHNVGKDSSSVFSNTASFGGQSSGGNSFTYERVTPKMQVQLQKKWVGDDRTKRPASIQVQLQRKAGTDGTWENVGEPVTITVNKNQDQDSYTWNDLLQYTEETDRKNYSYRVVELDASGNAVAEGGMNGEYAVSYGNANGISQSGTVQINNTWENMNVTVQKNWVGDEQKDRPETISVKLQQRLDGLNDWTDVAGVEPKTLSNVDNATATWENLPRKNADGTKIFYRVVEVNSLTDYTPTYDATGINQTGTVKITNTYRYISVSVEKKWKGNDSNGNSVDMAAPDNISQLTFQLQRKTTGDWENVANSGTQEVSKTDGKFEYTWAKLPKADENGNPYYYRVIETPVPDGYDASGWDETGTNTNKTFTITNQQESDYTKTPTTATEYVWTSSEMNAVSNRKDVTSITSEDLKGWVTKTIDGTEYYLFGWKVTLSSWDKNSLYIDKLPENSILYEEQKYGVVIKQKNINPMEVTTFHDRNQYYTYDKTNNIVNFLLGRAHGRNTEVEYFTYTTAVPKSIVDAAIAANGKYELTNKIKKTTETNYKDSTLTIEKKGDTPTESNLLEKSMVKTDGKLNGKKIGRPEYQLVVNPDGKKLSNSDKIELTDTFEITGYQEKGQTRVDGSNLVDADLFSVNVRDINTNRLLDTSEYSYMDSIVEDRRVETVDCGDPTKSNAANLISYQEGSYYVYSFNYTFLKGTELVVEVEGTPGEKVELTQYSPTDNTIIATPETDSYDADGKVRIKIKFNRNSKNENPACNFTTKHATSKNITFVSATLQKEIVSVKHILSLTLPDETPLQIWYRYQLKTNENTPDTDKNITASGAVPPAGDKIYMKNEAILQTSNGSAGDHISETEFEILEAEASVETISYPKIKKVDVGDYSIELDATFKLAKYVDGKWHYATAFTPVNGTDGKFLYNEVTYGDSGIETGTTIPAAAADLKVESGGYTIGLQNGTLYKLIEVASPSGYEKVTWNASKTLEQMDAYTFYFLYDGDKNTLPSSVPKDRVNLISANGTLQVKNNQLIDIGAKKTWSETITEADHASVNLELWYATTKSDTIPSSAKLATAENLGLSDETFSPEYTLTATKDADGNLVWENDKIWSVLPNGKNGVPYYYYVKEVSYTIGGTTYTIANDGSSTGTMKPFYSGNGLNKTGEVAIVNSAGLTIRKEWKNSDNTAMAESDIPVDTVAFQLYGMKDGVQTTEPIYTGELKKADGWKLTVPDNITLTGYDSFKIMEVNTGESLYGYIISDVYNVQNGTGEIKLINKNNTPTTVQVEATKVWGDGADLHTSDSVSIQLYRATRNLTNSEIAALEQGTIPANTELVTGEANVTLSAANQWKHTWSNLPYKGDSGRYFYYPIEVSKTVNNGQTYVSSYSRADRAASQEITITNKIPGSFTINKSWQNSDGTAITQNLPESIQVELYKRAVSSSGGSSGDSNDDSNNTEGNKPTRTVKIMAVGDSITDGYSEQDGYRKYFYHRLVDQKKYSIDMVGSKDGWTATWDFDDGTYSYDPANTGYSGYTIQSYQYNNQNRIGIFETISSGEKKDIIQTTSPEIVLLMIGTNDIMDSYKMDEIQARLQALVDEIYRQKSDVTLMIMSPLPIDAPVSGWLQQDTMNTNIKTCMTAIKKIVDAEKAAGKKCEYLATNELFTKQTDYTAYLNDYCHPNRAGYTLMGNYLADAVDSYLRTGSVNVDSSTGTITAETNISGLPSDFTTNPSAYKLVGTYSVTAAQNWTLSIPNLEEGYAYYVKEVDQTGWTPNYAHNGQLADNNQAIEITNTKTVEKVSVSVEKQWRDASSATHGDISVKLYRRLEDGNWETEPVRTATLLSADSWKYTFADLEKTNADGTKLYYYKVVENPISGYQAVYSDDNTNGVNGNTASTPLVITNVKVFALSVQKTWAETPTANATIQVELHRSTDLNQVPDRVKNQLQPTVPVIKLSAASTSVTVGETLQIISSIDGVTYSSMNKEIATVDATTGLVTAKKAGSVTIKAAKEGCTEGTIDLTVTEGSSENPEKEYQFSDATAGDTIIVTVIGTPYTVINGCFGYNGTSGWYQDEFGNRTIGSDGTLTLEHTVRDTYTGGNIYFKVWHNNAAVSKVEHTVQHPVRTITLTPSATTLKVGGTVTLTSNVDGVTYSSSDSNIATVSANGVVTGVGAGSVTITATKNGYTDGTIDLTVTSDSTPPQTGDKIDATINQNSNENYTINFSQAIGSEVHLVFHFNDGIAYGNGCVGFSVTVDESSYWVSYKWEASQSGEIVVSLNQPNQVKIGENDIVNSADAALIAKIVAETQKQTSAQVQVWWVENNDDKSNIRLTGAYILTDSGGSGGGDTPSTPTQITITPSATTLKVGGTVTLTSNVDGVAYSSSNEQIATVSANGVVTGIGAGSVTITATKDGCTDGTIALTVTSDSGGDDSKSQVVKLKGISANDDKNGVHVIYFENGKTSADVESIRIDAENVQVTGWSGSTIALVKHVDNPNYEANSLHFGEIADKQVFTFNKSDKWGTDRIALYIAVYGTLKMDVNVTITYASTSTQSLTTPRRAVSAAAVEEGNAVLLYGAEEPVAYAASSTDPTYVDVVTISQTDTWQKAFENLPVYDENGTRYYYWVEEIDVQPGGTNTYDIRYAFEDADDDTTYAINAEHPGNAVARIQNTKTTDESYTLPSTGGTGVTRYYLIGLLLMGGSGLVVCYQFRRKRHGNCAK